MLRCPGCGKRVGESDDERHGHVNGLMWQQCSSFLAIGVIAYDWESRTPSQKQLA